MIHFDRLRTLHKFMNNLTPKQVSMNHLFNNDEGCGTVVCAMGWATSIPEFQALGLKVGMHPDGYRALTFPGAVVEDYDLYSSAAAGLFGLDTAGVENIFGCVGNSMYDAEPNAMVTMDPRDDYYNKVCNNHLALFNYRMKRFFLDQGEML